MTRSPFWAIRVGANVRIISECCIILNYFLAKVVCFYSSQPQIKPILSNYCDTLLARGDGAGFRAAL